MNKRLKRIGLFLSVAVLGVAASVSLLANSPKEVSQVDALITSNDVRIIVVRPIWWENDGNWQVLRIAPTAADLTNNVIANITYKTIESYTADTYYNVGSGGFDGYDTSGVVFYDVPISQLTDKYFDLARLSTSEPTTALVNNKTTSELWNNSMLHKVWRIFGDGTGIYRPEGAEAESRNVSNGVITSLLYGYLTCSVSELNGSGSFNLLNDNFNMKGHVFTSEDKFIDYADGAMLNYGEDRGAGRETLTSDKIATMEAVFNGIDKTQNIGYLDSASSLPFIIGVSLVGLTSIAGLYILRKKRA